MKLLRAWGGAQPRDSSLAATPPAVLRPPPHKLLCASSFAQALLRSFDAVVNRLQAALDATDAATTPSAHSFPMASSTPSSGTRSASLHQLHPLARRPPSMRWVGSCCYGGD
uniref:Uncharacterized protein n=1 Tax=Oryza nivara TaxID=4536 RepID=A0A0E0J169_ORYNI